MATASVSLTAKPLASKRTWPNSPWHRAGVRRVSVRVCQPSSCRVVADAEANALGRAEPAQSDKSGSLQGRGPLRPPCLSMWMLRVKHAPCSECLTVTY